MRLAGWFSSIFKGGAALADRGHSLLTTSVFQFSANPWLSAVNYELGSMAEKVLRPTVYSTGVSLIGTNAAVNTLESNMEQGLMRRLDQQDESIGIGMAYHNIQQQRRGYR